MSLFKTHGKLLGLVGAGCGVLLNVIAPGYAAELTDEAADLFAGETFGTVKYSYTSDGAAVMSFVGVPESAYSPPPCCAGTLVADGGMPSSPFAGDYVAAGVTGLTFKIMSDGHKPASAMVIFKSRSGRTWINESVVVSDQAGLWVTGVIPFDRASGWTRGGSDLDAKWAVDIRSVTMIGIRICQGGWGAQSYAIGDFMLVGPYGPSFRATLTPLQLKLLERFNVIDPGSVSDNDRKVDSDFDGMTDLIEILSKYDLDFANMTFVADILAVNDTGVTVRWPCVEGYRYTVLRSGQISGEFSLLPNSEGFALSATSTGYMIFTDKDAAGKEGPFYYKVLKGQ